MIVFLSLAALFTLVVVAALVLPLVRRRTRQRQVDDTADLAAYRDRLAELQQEHERGVISADELAVATEELERELLLSQETGGPGETAAEQTPARATAIGIALLVPIGAIVVYALTGQPDLARTGGPGEMSSARVQELQSMPPQTRIDHLERWVRDHTQSAQGWSLLAQAYREAEAYGDAAAAFARARAAGANDAWLIARQAETLLLANNRRFTKGVERLLEDALDQDARNPLALMLSGQAAMVDGDPETAASFWRRLAEVLPEDGQQRRFIEQLVARAEAEARGETVSSEPAHSGLARDTAPADANVDGEGPSVTVTVSLGDGLADAVDPGDTVFVFARSPSGGGPPLAVARTNAGALPQRIVLDDSDSMAPQFKLSQADRVIVTARVSRSGEALPRSGDLEGSSEEIELAGSPEVDLRIDRRIP